MSAAVGEQTGQPLHLVDEDRLAPRLGGQRREPFLELVRVARKLEVGRLMEQVDGQIRDQLRDESRLPRLPRAEQEDALVDRCSWANRRGCAPAAWGGDQTLAARSSQVGR